MDENAEEIMVATDQRYRPRMVPVMVRMPEELRKQLAGLAEENHRSLSREAVRAIEEALRLRKAFSL